MTEGDRGLLLMLAGVVVIGLVAGRAGEASKDAAATAVRLDSYAEWKLPDALVVDGQRVVVDGGTKWKGKFTTVDAVPLGAEVRVEGERHAGGAVLAREIDVRPNGKRCSKTRCRPAPRARGGLAARRVRRSRHTRMAGRS